MNLETVTINSIKKLKKKSMYEITIDDQTLKVSEDCIVKYDLYKGKTISIEELKKIKKSLKTEELFLKTCDYITYQMRSKTEIMIYLHKNECSKNDIDLIVNRLLSLGYIDDELLARNLLTNICNHLKGPKAFEEKLFLRKIEKEIINKVKYDNDVEKEIIQKAIDKCRNKNNQYPKNKQKNLLASKLIRDGFSTSLVFSSLTQVESEGFFIDESEKTIKGDINKLQKKYQDLDTYTRKKKIISSLLAKGYLYSVIINYLDISEE